VTWNFGTTRLLVLPCRASTTYPTHEWTVKPRQFRTATNSISQKQPFGDRGHPSASGPCLAYRRHALCTTQRIKGWTGGAWRNWPFSHVVPIFQNACYPWHLADTHPRRLVYSFPKTRGLISVLSLTSDAIHLLHIISLPCIDRAVTSPLRNGDLRSIALLSCPHFYRNRGTIGSPDPRNRCSLEDP